LIKLVYIGGFGRSGSTLLEYLLTAHPQVLACGEVERHLRRFGRKKVCTCGERILSCPVWGPFQNKKGKLQGWDHKRLTLALLHHISEKYSVMVDSSKTAWGSLFMPFRLSQELREDFVLVQIVRDPRGVAWSAIKTARQKGRGLGNSPTVTTIRTVVGWMAANLACETFGWYRPASYLTVRYEDLVRNSDLILAEILWLVSLKPPATFEPKKGTGNRHQLYGNAMRFKPISPSSLAEDVNWKAEMPRSYRWLVSAVSWPLLRRYGY
jgi:hypothetical protein